MKSLGTPEDQEREASRQDLSPKGCREDCHNPFAILNENKLKIQELERIIVEAKGCVTIAQEECDKKNAEIAKLKDNNLIAQKQIAALLRSIVHLRNCNNENLERIEKNLKLVKLYF